MAKQKIPNKETDKVLVIVESPTKATHLEPMFRKLGFKHVKVMASKGHITKIPDVKGSFYNTGIYPEENFKVKYVVEEKHKKIVSDLKAAVDKADFVYLMTDSDREGSAISTHLKSVLKIPNEKYYRITVHEITQAAVEKALQNPGKIDDNLSDSALAREMMDKIEGFVLSKYVQRGVKARSAGRCQSPTLSVICKREQEIKDFVPTKYWELYLHFEKNKQEFLAKYIGTKDKELKSFDTLDACASVVEECKGNPYTVQNICVKKITENPKPPFTTSTFQIEANRVLGMGAKQSMDICQKLFQSGWITYHRSDDDSIDPGFLQIMQGFIVEHYGKSYLGELRQGKKSANQQEGHEALRVTDIALTPDLFIKKGMSEWENKVYRLIYIRTLQSTMSAAIYNDTQYTINNGKHLFFLHNKELLFDGFKTINKKEEDVIVIPLKEGEVLKKTSLETQEKQTNPPSRYDQGRLIQLLKDSGVGRPSTYASIVETVISKDHGYCIVQDKEIIPTELGEKTANFLNKTFKDFISVDFTSKVEEELDKIANGEEKYLDFLNGFYSNLRAAMKEVGEIKSTPAEKVGRVCPKCGKPLVYRTNRLNGNRFIGCSGWRPHDRGCNYMESCKD